jgi:hypothetical protein
MHLFIYFVSIFFFKKILVFLICFIMKIIFKNFCIFVWLDAGLKFGKRRQTSFFFQVWFFSLSFALCVDRGQWTVPLFIWYHIKRGTVQTPTGATTPLTTTSRSLRRARLFKSRESGPRSSSRSCHAAFCLPRDALCGRHMRLLFANHVFWMTHDTLKYLVAILATTA